MSVRNVLPELERRGLIKATVPDSVENLLTITTGADGTGVTVSVGGDKSDTNAGLTIDTKGTGTLTLGSSDSTAVVLDGAAARIGSNPIMKLAGCADQGNTTATLTAAELLSGIIPGTPTANSVYTVDTAANIVAAIPGCVVGSSFLFLVNNVTAATYTITLSGAATGITYDGTCSVAAATARLFLATVTNVSSPAVTIFGIGA